MAEEESKTCGGTWGEPWKCSELHFAGILLGGKGPSVTESLAEAAHCLLPQEMPARAHHFQQHLGIHF